MHNITTQKTYTPQPKSTSTIKKYFWRAQLKHFLTHTIIDKNILAKKKKRKHLHNKNVTCPKKT